MAAPNIVNVTTITGVTTALVGITSVATSFVSNAASSNKVFKINTIIGVNTDGATSVDVTVRYHLAANAGVGYSVPIANTISVPPDSSLVIIGKDSPIYLEENRSLSVQASVVGKLGIICSYEDIS